MFISICFSIIATVSLWAYHGGGDYGAGKKPQSSSLRGFLFIQRYVQASSVAVTLLSLNFSWEWLLTIHQDSAMRYIGLAVSSLGTALFLWAKLVLAENFSPCYDAYNPFRIVRAGPYRIIRHPIYTANMITVFGQPVAFAKYIRTVSLLPFLREKRGRRSDITLF